MKVSKNQLKRKSQNPTKKIWKKQNRNKCQFITGLFLSFSGNRRSFLIQRGNGEVCCNGNNKAKPIKSLSDVIFLHAS
ncbi:unnamed protein product [Lactuca virosa]|uniref:Ribosomal protein L32 n=1 Tax=Lactuca virosa TaxID=75947 RepID=A0AAU9N2Z3_9ASTR|nr:unnamed protein product [Lactuca virosa]